MSSRAISAEVLAGVCGSARWRQLMLAQPEYVLPAPTCAQLQAASERCFDQLGRADWLEAFAAHSTLGAPRPEDVTGSREQAGLDGAHGDLRTALAAANVEYRRRFGFVFLIRARGRSGEEVLAALRQRLTNPPETELANACAEQREITALRLETLAETLAARTGTAPPEPRGI